jgi:hypothetical protein
MLWTELLRRVSRPRSSVLLFPHCNKSIDRSLNFVPFRYRGRKVIRHARNDVSSASLCEVDIACSALQSDALSLF